MSYWHFTPNKTYILALLYTAFVIKGPVTTTIYSSQQASSCIFNNLVKYIFIWAVLKILVIHPRHAFCVWWIQSAIPRWAEKDFSFLTSPACKLPSHCWLASIFLFYSSFRNTKRNAWIIDQHVFLQQL